MGINDTFVKGYADSITGLINNIIVPMLISVAFLVFLWGIYKYFIQGADNEEARTTGKVFTLYGIVGFVVLFSVWGIVQIMMGTLNIGAANAPRPPTIGTSGSGGATGVTGGGTYIPGTNINTGGGSPTGGGSYNTGGGGYYTGGSYPVGGGTTYSPYSTGSGGSTAYDPVSQTAISMQLGDAYAAYNTCMTSGAPPASDPSCTNARTNYQNLADASGGLSTCGLIFKDVCAPGSTCSTFGYCEYIPTASVAEGGKCNGSSGACEIPLICGSANTCINPCPAGTYSYAGDYGPECIPNPGVGSIDNTAAAGDGSVGAFCGRPEVGDADCWGDAVCSDEESRCILPDQNTNGYIDESGYVNPGTNDTVTTICNDWYANNYGVNAACDYACNEPTATNYGQDGACQYSSYNPEDVPI